MLVSGGRGVERRERRTYAMAAMRGPLEVKSSPVDRTVPPWMRVGCIERE